MKWELHENSLFAVLLRSPWWLSLLIAAALAALLRLFLPIEFAIFGGLPFLIISLVVLWRQIRRPSAKRIAKALENARALPANECSRATTWGRFWVIASSALSASVSAKASAALRSGCCWSAAR